MTTLSEKFGLDPSGHPLRTRFFGWQCRLRQMAMRENQGRPDDGVMPAVMLPGEEAPLGHIITLINKTQAFDVTPELRHMARRTQEEAQRRDKALQFFSEAYYQKPETFSDGLTATFAPQSQGAALIKEASRCRLVFEAFSQRFDLDCGVLRLEPEDYLYQATWWHNLLFNPSLHPDTIILAFLPDWDSSGESPPR